MQGVWVSWLSGDHIDFKTASEFDISSYELSAAIIIMRNLFSKLVRSYFTDYESDYTKPYTTLLGCEVENLNIIPKGMIGKEFEGGSYRKFTAKGDLVKGAVFGEWSKIWEMDLERVYTADFDAYGEKAQNPTNAEVDIFVAIKKKTLNTKTD